MDFVSAKYDQTFNVRKNKTMIISLDRKHNDKFQINGRYFINSSNT